MTEWAEGALYAEDLRRLARGDAAAPLDLTRADALAGYLAALHAEARRSRGVAARRARSRQPRRGDLRDGRRVLGRRRRGAAARAIEERCLAWRWRLRDRPARLTRTHGDFHPFNIVFRPPAAGEDGSRFALLDASRGGKGDPADDVIALSVNYPSSRSIFPGWRALRAAVAPLLGAVPVGDRRRHGPRAPRPTSPGGRSCSPRRASIPRLSAAARDALPPLAERALDAGRLDLAWAEELFPERAP